MLQIFFCQFKISAPLIDIDIAPAPLPRPALDLLGIDLQKLQIRLDEGLQLTCVFAVDRVHRIERLRIAEDPQHIALEHLKLPSVLHALQIGLDRPDIDGPAHEFRILRVLLEVDWLEKGPDLVVRAESLPFFPSSLVL